MSGRIYTLLLSTKAGQVVYERFYDSFSEAEKAEIRAAFDAVAPPGSAAVEEAEYTGRYKSGRIVMIPSGELLLFALGTGEYSELALAEVLRAVAGALRDTLKVAALGDAALFANYAATVLVVDEVIKEGLVEHVDSAAIARAVALKLPVEAVPDSRGRGLKSMFSSTSSKPAQSTPSS